jgi:glycosyltransferase involved in cell wall biosynthesis
MTRLRVLAVNGMFLDPGVSGGTETYLRNLLPEIAAERPGLRIRIFTTGRGARALTADGWTEWADVSALPAEEGRRLRRLAAEQALVPWAVRGGRVDVLHSMGNTGPLLSPAPHVMTVHDVTFLTTGTLSRAGRLAHRVVVTPAARRADRLIAISEAARAEISRVLRVPPERFTIVPHGPGATPSEPLPEADVRARHRLDGRRVVLCVAAKRPHKNQEALLRALPALPGDTVVVLAGHAEAYDERLRALAADLGVADRVRFVGYVPDAELEGLWRLAACAAFPTTAEGFGLPVVEAMRRGVPVACSDLPVLREVGGDVPRYFDPADPADVAATVRQAMIAGYDRTGVERAARFTWRAAAQRTLDAYERALAARS